ncbi:MAG: ATP-binding cassette domain-containing protein, partial [Agromyces sp.]
NVALPLEYLGVTPAESRRRVAELLDRVGLSSRANFSPHELSGGQRQRVGIARALALRPSVVLSDEATSGLDPDSTRSIVTLLRELRDDLGLSILFISHEMDTVRSVADSVAKLDHGRITEHGTLLEVLQSPSSDLGRQLRPHGSIGAEPGVDASWRVTFVSDAVPSDWLHILSERIGAPIALHSANIERVGGGTIGEAIIGVPARLPHDLARFGAELSLAIEPLSGGEPNVLDSAALVAIGTESK